VQVLKGTTDVRTAADALPVLLKAADEFLAAMIDEAALNMTQEGRRELVYADVANVVARSSCLTFLADVVPQTVTAEEYLATAEQQQQ